jgi:hypothetical protein
MTEETLFIVALEIPEAADRGTFLDWACAGDAALRGRVGRLLDQHERASSLFGRPPAPRGRSADAGGGSRQPDSPGLPRAGPGFADG